jgi:group I intron endonuclease
MSETKPTTQSGIYQIRNTINDKIYIGSAVNIRDRWRTHRRDLNDQKHHGPHLQRAWIKYGASAFVFEVLEIVPNKEDLIRIEQQYLDQRKPFDREIGYNTSPTAGSPLGVKRSAEFRAKLSKRVSNPSQETRTRMSASQAKRTHPPEVRAKISASTRGKPKSSETRAKMVAALRRRVLSPEQIDRLREMGKANAARPISDEIRAKMSAAQQGRKHSEETRTRMAEAQREHWKIRKAKRGQLELDFGDE